MVRSLFCNLHCQFSNKVNLKSWPLMISNSLSPSSKTRFQVHWTSVPVSRMPCSSQSHWPLHHQTSTVHFRQVISKRPRPSRPPHLRIRSRQWTTLPRWGFLWKRWVKPTSWSAAWVVWLRISLPRRTLLAGLCSATCDTFKPWTLLRPCSRPCLWHSDQLGT